MMSIAISHPLPQYHIEEYDTTLGSSILCWSNMNTSISIYPRYMYAYSNFNQFLFTRCSTHLHIVHTLTNDCSRCLLDKALILLFFYPFGKYLLPDFHHHYYDQLLWINLSIFLDVSLQYEWCWHSIFYWTFMSANIFKKNKTKQVNPFIVVIFYVFETERLCNVPLSVKLATLTFSENSMKELQKFN